MMNQISKALVTISLISAAFAAVAGTEQESAMRHDHTVGDGHQVMLDLLKRGEVVSVAPMNKERSDNKAINNTAVAGAECNTVIELKPEHHAASPWHFA